MLGDHWRPRQTTLSWTTDVGFENSHNSGRPRETMGDHTVLSNGFGVWKRTQLSSRSDMEDLLAELVVYSKITHNLSYSPTLIPKS